MHPYQRSYRPVKKTDKLLGISSESLESKHYILGAQRSNTQLNLERGKLPEDTPELRLEDQTADCQAKKDGREIQEREPSMQRPKFNEWIKEFKEDSTEGKPEEVRLRAQGSHIHVMLQGKL